MSKRKGAKHIKDNPDAWHRRHAWMGDDRLEGWIDSLMMKGYHKWKQNNLAFERVSMQNGQVQFVSWPTMYYLPDVGAFSPIGGFAA